MTLNEALVLNLLSDALGTTPIYIQNIGSFTGDDAITITATLDPIVTTGIITGILNDCSNIPVAQGYVQVDFLGATTTAAVASDGTFEVSIIR